MTPITLALFIPHEINAILFSTRGFTELESLSTIHVFIKSGGHIISRSIIFFFVFFGIDGDICRPYIIKIISSIKILSLSIIVFKTLTKQEHQGQITQIRSCPKTTFVGIPLESIFN